MVIQLNFVRQAQASDHIDGPQLAHDHASDINDMYFFLDPNDNSRVVMIMTINPFLISSEIIGQAIFDHNLRYRFEIENTGDARPDRFIDVRFTRGVGREVEPQTALVTLPNGQRFEAAMNASIPNVELRSDGIPILENSGLDLNGLLNGENFIARTNIPSQGDDTNDIEPPALPVTTDSATGVSFFAGVTDDPFFLDNTAANRFVLSSVRNPGNPNREVFRNRAGFNAPDGSDPNADNQGAAPLQARNQGVNQGAGRDTYAGFSTLTIAVSVPSAMLRAGNRRFRNFSGDELGLNGVTQRQRLQIVRPDGQVSGAGDWVTVDREGVPLVNNGLIPPARKDEYNGARTIDDARGRFRTDLIISLKNFGTSDENIRRLLDMIQVRGDILRLNLRVPNSGPGGGSNPDGGAANMGGRRLQDDVADATFTLINNGQPLGDFVDRNEFIFGNTFPFVAPQVMPNPNGINSVDDRTRL
ncbi:MAG: DUF4331 domain-containing protein [Acidobacteriota bacterium]|nr:DUF4331 domain-containing protein [Acidobacteriota bacterium]